jgi:hypothetical protein
MVGGGKARTYHLPVLNCYYIVDKTKDNISIEADAHCTDEGVMYKRVPGQHQEA